MLSYSVNFYIVIIAVYVFKCLYMYMRLSAYVMHACDRHACNTRTRQEMR